jgi:hypothetical protein
VTLSTSIMIRGKAARSAPTIARRAHKQQSSDSVDRFSPIQKSCRLFLAHPATPAEYG